jgi:CBS-domain-containing membrane protein
VKTATVAECLRHLYNESVESVPLIDDDGKLVEILSDMDLVMPMLMDETHDFGIHAEYMEGRTYDATWYMCCFSGLAIQAARLRTKWSPNTAKAISGPHCVCALSDNCMAVVNMVADQHYEIRRVYVIDDKKVLQGAVSTLTLLAQFLGLQKHWPFTFHWHQFSAILT